MFQSAATLTKALILGVIISSSLSASSQAQDLTGLCIDNVEAGCMSRYLNFYGNAVDFCEATCELTNPVAVRGLDATLYDFVCGGDHNQPTVRVMLIKQTDFNGRTTMSIVDATETRSIVPCP